jgi:hypothetical protein
LHNYIEEKDIRARNKLLEEINEVFKNEEPI